MNKEEWISTEKCPPSQGQAVLVCWRVKDGLASDEMVVAKFEPDRDGSPWNSLGPGIDTPSHWMSLPELLPLIYPGFAMKYHVLDLNQIKLRQGYGIPFLELEDWLNRLGRKYVDHIEVNGQTYVIAEVDDAPEGESKL